VREIPNFSALSSHVLHNFSDAFISSDCDLLFINFLRVISGAG